MPAPGSLAVTRIIAAPRARVWKAWTNAEALARWFIAGTDWRCVPTADVRVGGAYRLEMYEPNDAVHVQFGVYRELVAPERLVFTWTCPELGVVDSVVTVELREHGADATELTLTHELLEDPVIRQGHERGWAACLGNLQTQLERHPSWP